MLKPRFLIGFTGHRSGFDEKLIRAALEGVLKDLQKRASTAGGQAELYASVAEGSDTLCVEVARDLGMPVHLLLPLPEEEFAKDFSSSEALGRSQRQLQLARQREGQDSVHLVPGGAQRPDCYFDQAMHMLDAVDVLVALWDGQPSRGLGGTAEVLAQALTIGTPVIQMDAATGRHQTIGQLTSRIAPDPVITELNEIAKEASAQCVQADGTADELQKCLDDIAVGEASRFRPSLVAIILLHGLAALLAATVSFELADKHAPWETSKWIITLAELLLVSCALWIGVRLHHRRTQARWIRCRFACELVRGLRASVPLLDPLHPDIGVLDPRWRRFALSAGLLVNQHQTSADPRVLRDAYLATRLSDTNGESQVRHYQSMQPRALWWWNFTGFVSKWSAILAPVFVVLSLINKVFHLGWQKQFGGWVVVVLLPIALPLIAGLANGIRQALDAGRRKERYPEMAARLTALRTRLQGLETRTSIAQAVSQAEEILLDERREWQLTAITTGH